MIFLTIGTQLPFDRLVEAVDVVADQIDEDVFGQIGASKYKPKNFQYVDYLAPTEFVSRFAEARAVIGHAGIGTLLSGQNYCKPVFVMARLSALGEHRNDHQIATAGQFRHIQGVEVFSSVDELLNLLRLKNLKPMSASPSPSLEQLVDRLRREILTGHR